MADLNIGNSSASVVVNIKHNGSIIPQINNTYDLGTSTLRWKNIYGSLKGNADSATKLATTRTISLTGSVTGSGTFDGSGNLNIATTTNHTHAAATTSANGFMSSDDKAKLDGITASADAVSFSRSLTSGTKVGTITINGTGTDLYAPTNTDTKNTAGSSNTNSKIFLVGATSQTSNTTTYSHDTTYVNSDEALISSAFTAGTNHIIAPKGGQYSTRTSTVTGYLKITLPVTWNNTMMRFYVDIYNYQTNTMVTYMIGGYNYSESSSWINVSAVAYGRKGSKLSNLKVHFGHDGSTCSIYIGSADTTWDYPQVIVRDILVGFGQSALDLDSGWSIGFTTTLGTITAAVDNPYIGYNAYTADNVAWSGITSKPSYYDAKAIKSITRSGTTFTATHLDGTTSTFTQQDNNTVYNHPAGSAASKSSGLYKFSTDGTSHISGVTTVTKADITALGIPGQDTTYGSMSVNEGTTGTATANRVLTAANLKGIINAHAPTKTGGGASGTWGISISGNAATASKVNNKLTVGSKSYDGSAAVTIEASDLGLASAMLFLGTTTTAITDGATTNPVVLGGSNKTVTAGKVVLYGSKEFVWTGSAWEELGNEGSYKIVQAAVADPSASGTSNTFIDTISQDANGKITATKKTVAVTNSAPTLAWGTTSTIGTVAGTNLQVKMPANPNTDTKVTQTVTTSNAAYPLLLAPSGQTATTTTTSYFDSGVTLNPSTNTIAANVSGNASTANGLKIQGILNSQEKIDEFLVANSLQYAIFSTPEQNNIGMGSNDGMIISIPWKETNSYGAQIAIDDEKKGIIKFRAKNGSWGSWFTLLHSGNYTGILDGRYVNASGDTMSGSLHFNIGDRKLSSATAPAHFIGNLHFYSTPGSGSAITDGTVNGITFGSSPTTAYAGIYSPSSNQYGNYLMFATTESYADGAKTRMVIDHVGRVGIGTTAPNYTLHVNGTQYIQSNSSASTTNGLTINNGVLAITNYNQTLTVGALNDQWIHFMTTGSQFYFNKEIHIDGDLTRYNYSGSGYGTISGYNLAGNASSATNADTVDNLHANSFLRKYNTNSEVGNTDELKSGSYIFTHGDGDNGNWPTGTKPPGSHNGVAIIHTHTHGGNYYTQLALDTQQNTLWIRSADATTTFGNWTRIWKQGDAVTGAVWNDYAEYREADTIQGGRCVREVGDDTLSLTTKRLMRGCSITSDTWGFAQGETEKAKTPIAVAGRVLAYPLEDRELFKEYIGYSVCSGPDGTVSLMTEEEELKYPWAIVGTVSAVPDYEEWGGGEMADRPSVKVDGRIWIKVK